MRLRSTSLILLALSVLMTSCAREEAGTEEKAEPLVSESRHGPVTATLKIEPGAVELDRRMIMTLTVSSPDNVEVMLPAIEDRVEGFIAGQSFERSSVAEGGGKLVEKVARLTPAVSDIYRIAPMPIVYLTSSTSGQKRNWFPTKPIIIDASLPEAGTGGINSEIKPVWVRPSAKEISLSIAALIAVAGLLVLVIKLIIKMLRYVRLLRMSPRDRALEELKILLSKDLVSKDLVKEFYLELTLIVRLFIERGYGIRAPEQTTEEFLASAKTDERFTPSVLNKLQAFLQSADLVKFAGFKPDQESTDAATEKAREFIRVDSSVNPDAGRKTEVSDA